MHWVYTVFYDYTVNYIYVHSILKLQLHSREKYNTLVWNKQVIHPPLSSAVFPPPYGTQFTFPTSLPIPHDPTE